MINRVFVFVMALQVAACTVVRFEATQPAEGIALPEFPKELQGLFVSEDQDTLEIQPLNFHFRNGEEIELKGDLTTSETVLKELSNYYILNLKDEGVWDAFPVKLKRGNVHVYFSATASRAEELMEVFKSTSSVMEIQDTEGDFEYYLIAPTPEEFQDLIRKKLFDEKIIFKRIH